MDKKDILEQNKKKKQGSLDEMEKRVYNYSFGIGALAVGAMCLAFSIYRAINGMHFYEFAAIITAYLCTTYLYRFKNLKSPFYLIAGIITAVAAVGCTVLFFVVGGV